MANPGKGTFQPDSDVHISFGDQQKINKFATFNAKTEDLKERITKKKNEINNFEEAIRELDFADDEEKIYHLIGEVFVGQSVEETVGMLNKSLNKTQNELRELEEQSAEVLEQMSVLKAHLYAKFGSFINLERDED